jgi:nicotinamide mononucleotide transporter
VAVIEAIAVALGVGYVVLAIYGRRACWIAGGLSSALYIAVFLESRLPLQSALQLAYVPLAIYGWAAWRGGADAKSRAVSWPLSRHLLILACVGGAAALSAPLLARYGASDAPWGESLGTWGSVAATWLVARRCLEAWVWWIVIDAGLAALFLSQGLVPTAALYVGFAVLAVAGWRTWSKGAAPA